VSNVLTEAEIVDGLRRGSRIAWAALCEQFGPRIWRFIARLVGPDETAARDVYQETFLAVAKSGRQISTGTKLWPWLAAIGHNQSALHWRNRSLDRRKLADSKPASANSDPEPLDRLIQQEQAEIVREILAEMTAEAVAVLTGKYLDGLSVDELVLQLGGSHESVRSRLARARREFRKRYEQAGLAEGTTNRRIAPALIPQEGDSR